MRWRISTQNKPHIAEKRSLENLDALAPIDAEQTPCEIDAGET
jgi:hypothetical protein